MNGRNDTNVEASHQELDFLCVDMNEAGSDVLSCQNFQMLIDNLAAEVPGQVVGNDESLAFLASLEELFLISHLLVLSMSIRHHLHALLLSFFHLLHSVTTDYFEIILVEVFKSGIKRAYWDKSSKAYLFISWSICSSTT